MNQVFNKLQILFILLTCSIGFAQAEEFAAKTKQISVKTFTNQFKNLIPYEQPTLNKITDIKIATKALSGRFTLTSKQVEIKNSAGKSVFQHIYQEGPDTFIAYYPKENLIQLEDWMQGDWIISTETGDEYEEVPSARVYSPKGNLRMSSYYNTQETVWFIQKKNNEQWTKLKEITMDPSAYKNLDSVRQFFWVDNESFIFENGNTKQFYQGMIINE